MGLRERVQQAITEPVSESERLLDQLESSDLEAKLSILISGWGRGLAAALEELAVALDDLRNQRSSATPAPPLKRQVGEEQSADSAPTSGATQADSQVLDEQQLIEQAKKSSEETAALGAETEEVRRDLEQ